MFKSSKGLSKDISLRWQSPKQRAMSVGLSHADSPIPLDGGTTLHRDRSIIFKQTLLDAAINNEFGFKEQDILPLFVKYQSKRQVLIDIFSFLTYVVQLPTRFYLLRLQNSNFIPKNNCDSDASRPLRLFFKKVI